MASVPAVTPTCSGGGDGGVGQLGGGAAVASRPGSSVEKLCAYELCRAMEDLMLCARCRGTWYCSRKHQKQHWGEHKKSCKVSAGSSTGARPVTRPKQSDDAPLHQENHRHGSSEVIRDADSAPPTPAAAAAATGPTELELERAKVQEDIAQFSANICRKPSYTLTPYETEAPGRPETKTSGRTTDEAEIGGNTAGDRESMPSGYHSGVMPTPPSETNHALVVSEHMRKFGVCVVDKFLKPEAGDAILEEVMHLRKTDAFTSGQLVTTSASGPSSSKDIRGDMITWTDGGNAETRNIGYLISNIDSIVLQCKGLLDGFKNINGRSKAMVACYPGNGTHYVKHVDNPNEDGRCVTCIYYLNKDWDSEKMGGSLRLYPRSQDVIANIDPIFNRLIFFWSDIRNPHEVMPAFNTRYAITVWYFDSVERKKALAANS